MFQERLKALKKGYGKKELGTVTLDMAIGGMRGIPVRTEHFLAPVLMISPTTASNSYGDCTIHRECFGRHHCWTLRRVFALEASASLSCRRVILHFSTMLSDELHSGQGLPTINVIWL